MSGSLQPHRLYNPWNSPGQNSGVGSRSRLQGILPTQGLNTGLLHCRRILYQLSRHLYISYFSIIFFSLKSTCVSKLSFLNVNLHFGTAFSKLCDVEKSSNLSAPWFPYLYLEPPPFAWWAVQKKDTNVF